MEHYIHEGIFELETGGKLRNLRIAYHTFGEMNADKSNVVWICHALTANSDPTAWGEGLVGEGKIINPTKYFIVCANIIGSCYGTTGPLDIDENTGSPYLRNFPFITIRDMVDAHILLRRHLGIDHIHLLMGGSMGGYQVLEWALKEPKVIKHIFLLATSATESAWGIAIHEAQRMALQADQTYLNNEPEGGAAGVRAARAIGMLTYRNYDIMVAAQTEPDKEKVDGLRAASYINYQGNKLAKRFNAYSYHVLTSAMDSHHLARGRNGSVAEILATITQPSLVLGFSSDILCPPSEQRSIAASLPNAQYHEIDSAYGHDGFLVESQKIGVFLREFLETVEG